MKITNMTKWDMCSYFPVRTAWIEFCYFITKEEQN